MAETLYADSSISGTVSTPANAYGVANGVFTTDTGNTSWTHRWGMDNLVGTIDAASTVTVTLRVRKVPGQLGNPTINSVQLFDTTTSLSTDSTGWSVTSGTGQDVVVSGMSISGITANGANLRCELVTTYAAGAPTTRTPVQLDAIAILVQNGVTTRKGQISWAELEVPNAPRKGQISWAELEMPDVPLFFNKATAGITTGTPLVANFPSATTSGNLLVAVFFSRGNVHTISTSGWNLARTSYDSGNDDTLEIWWKQADGTETTVSVDLETAETSGDTLWIGECSALGGSATLDQVSSAGPTAGSATQSSGTTPTTTAAAEVAVVGFSQRANVVTHDSYSNGFTQEGYVSAGSAALLSDMSVAAKELSATGAIESTLTMSGAGSFNLGLIATFKTASTDRYGQVSWAELEVPTAPRKGQVSWAELEVPTAPRKGQVSWAELELPTAPRKGQLSWAELEAPDAPRYGQISWAELEAPSSPRYGQISWAELELVDAPRKGQVSWAELELPTAPRYGQVSWAELEIPERDRFGQVSWAELEVPTAPRFGQISWAETEVPDAPRKGQISWAELELPDGARRGQVSWAEIEVPTAPRYGQVSWAELETPSLAGDRYGWISWAELEIPTAPRRGQVSWTEYEMGDAPRKGQVSWAEIEFSDAPRRGQISWAELEVPPGARKGQVSWAELEVPTAPRKGQLSWVELEVPVGARRGQISWAELETEVFGRYGRISWAALEIPNAPGAPTSTATRMMLLGHS